MDQSSDSLEQALREGAREYRRLKGYPQRPRTALDAAIDRAAGVDHDAIDREWVEFVGRSFTERVLPGIQGHEGPFWVGPIECGASQLSRVIDSLRELVKADGRYRIRWGTAQGEHAMQWILHGMAEKRDKVWQPGMR